ncbi:MAG TPA: 30S ribosomal protein S14 [Candidatus Nanoarchaeia archaeon]|nr:30S ribosomal protein S14 [Candidatus Nanoarchaeia archaeon]
MTTSDWKKAFTQLRSKPVIWKKFNKFNKPKERSCGIALRHCARCNRTGGHIRSYGIGLCRQCFREIAQRLGFKKYS